MTTPAKKEHQKHCRERYGYACSCFPSSDINLSSDVFEPTPAKEWREQFRNQFWLHRVPKNTKQMHDIEDFIQNLLTTHSARLVDRLESKRKEFVPADNVWVGDDDYEVGEWKLVPKEDGMWCLNCEQFIPEEGCACGVISIDQALDIIKDNK